MRPRNTTFQYSISLTNPSILINNLIVGLLIFVSQINSYCQVSEEHLIGTYDYYFGLASEKINDTLLITASKNSIFLTTETGKVLKSVTLSSGELYPYYNEIVVMNNKRIFIGGRNNSSFGILMEFDTALNLIRSIKIDKYGSTFYKLAQINDSLIIGMNPQSLMVIDTNFSNCKFYDIADNPVEYSHIAVSANHMVYLVGNSDFPHKLVLTKFNLQTKYAEFHKYFNRPGYENDYFNAKQLLLHNDSLYFVWYTLMVFDTNGNFNRHSYLAESINNIRFEDDTTYIGWGDYLGIGMVTSNIIVGKYNLNSGVIWQNEYGFCNDESASSVFKMHGGYTVTGSVLYGAYGLPPGIYFKHFNETGTSTCFSNNVYSEFHENNGTLEDSLVEFNRVFSNVAIKNYPLTFITDTLDYEEVCSISYQDSCDIPFPHIQDANDSNIKFYYNNESKYIEFIFDNNVHFENNLKYFIVDISGRTLLSDLIDSDYKRISVGSLLKGVYVIVVNSDYLQPVSYKFAVY